MGKDAPSPTRALPPESTRSGDGWGPGAHRCASPADLLVAVVARQHGLTVLHQDADVETIAKVTGQPVRRIRG